MTAAVSHSQPGNTALRRLVAKLELIHEHPRFKAVWECAHFRLGAYDGPTYTQELADAKAALAIPEEAFTAAGEAEIAHKIEEIICGGNCAHPDICDGSEVTWCGKRTEELMALYAAPPAAQTDGVREQSAFLRYLQFENECDGGVTGKPCRAEKCGCMMEMQEWIDETQSSPQVNPEVRS